MMNDEFGDGEVETCNYARLLKMHMINHSCEK